MRSCLAFLVLMFAACGDDGGSSPQDAPAGAACTNALYDPCTDNTQCDSATCKLFMGDNLQVCSMTCTAGAACPMQGATAITCNNMGFCKPPAANPCTR